MDFNWFYVLLNIQQPFHYIILKQHIFLANRKTFTKPFQPSRRNIKLT